MSVFASAFDYLMSHENPGLTGKVTKDSGGLTRWGISQKSYPCLDIANLSLEDAANIYRNDFFKPIRGYEIEDQRIASKLLDMAVNMGLATAVKIAQLALKIFPDGRCGPLTLAACNLAKPDELLAQLVKLSEDHYYAIAQARPEEEKYLEGWLTRARALPEHEGRAEGVKR